MEAELNIAEILKDKPKNTKLFDIQKCIGIGFDHVEVTRKAKKTFIWCNYRKEGKTLELGYSEFGKERGWVNGMQILVPSKQMRDWDKFAWERGDILRDENTFVMFDGWVGDDYSEFKAAFEIFSNGSFDKGDSFLTENFRKAEYELSKKFIKKVEKYYGCTIDPKTFAISNYEDFKDGDVLATNESESFAKCIFIFSRKLCNNFHYHALLNTNSRNVYGKGELELDVLPHLATEEEKQVLFSVLKKNNKRWDDKQKKIVGIFQDEVFKVFDKVLVRDTDSEHWNAALFSHKEGNLFYIANGSYKLQCLPYNESTKHLLGTNKRFERK